MKKTILAASLALIAGSAIACDTCTGYASSGSGGVGVMGGGAVNAVGAYSAATNGVSVSGAKSGSFSGAAVELQNSADVGRGNTASADSSIKTSTYNETFNSAGNLSMGHATGGALAGGVAGSYAAGKAVGGAEATNTERVWFWSVPTGHSDAEYQIGAANASGVASGVLAGRNEGGVTWANAGADVNAIGGVEVKNCDDIAAASGYFADSKTAKTEAGAFGNATQGAIAGAGGIAGGTFEGKVWNLRGETQVNLPKPNRNF